MLTRITEKDERLGVVGDTEGGQRLGEPNLAGLLKLEVRRERALEKKKKKA